MKAEYVSHYLSDKDIANFARQSFAQLADQYSAERNAQLIQFLARGMTSKDWGSFMEKFNEVEDPQDAHKLAVYARSIPEHWVPFGHPQITLRMQAPISIRVQCFKHKIGFIESEESRRYISVKPSLYMPASIRGAAENVKQGSGGTHEDAAYWMSVYEQQCTKAIETYEKMISAGVAPEQARFILPQGCEVNWVWTGSLYAFAHAYNLRTDSHAQLEIQDLFHEVGEIIEPLFPVAWPALTQGKY